MGCGKNQISKIILLETVLVGIISLIVGLVVGVFGSQFMSILVGKLFEADMSKLTFVFSIDSCIKTCIYFAVMFIAVMIFNAFTISKYKLINLLTANKKNEEVKIKNPILCIIIFLIPISILGYCYYKVTIGVNELVTADKIIPIIILGIISTILVFWSLSGFILKVVQARKKIYLKDVNMFILRQLNNKINTTVISMSLICLMLFMTILILSSSLSLNSTMRRDMQEMTPVDINLYKTANLPESYQNPYTGVVENYTKIQIEDSKKTVEETLVENGFDINNLKDIVEIPVYASNELTMKDLLKGIEDMVKMQFPQLRYDTPEEIIKVSDYNKIAKLYGNEEYSLENNQFIVLCDFESMENLRNQALEKNNTINLKGKEYKAKYNECKEGFIDMSSSHINTGIMLVPDDVEFEESEKERVFLAANYNAETEEEKENIEKLFTDAEDSELYKNVLAKGLDFDGMTKISIIESSVGVSTMVLFIAIYLGIIFLIASSAILALKQLTESSDNKERYMVLRKIGVDEKIINKALFKQIGLFFIFPLILAIIHSICSGVDSGEICICKSMCKFGLLFVETGSLESTTLFLLGDITSLPFSFVFTFFELDLFFVEPFEAFPSFIFPLFNKVNNATILSAAACPTP